MQGKAAIYQDKLVAGVKDSFVVMATQRAPAARAPSSPTGSSGDLTARAARRRARARRAPPERANRDWPGSQESRPVASLGLGGRIRRSLGHHSRDDRRLLRLCGAARFLAHEGPWPRDVRLLRGRRDQWVEARGRWSTEVPRLGETPYLALSADPEILASGEAVEAAIDAPGQLIVDVRAEVEYTGERFSPSGATADAGRVCPSAGSATKRFALRLPLVHAA